MPGERIGRYRLLAPIASGGMAHVWAAKPEGKLGFSRTVALKVIRPEYSADAEYSRMLIDEAIVAGAVHHPNVCELYEFDEADGMLFMVMEWVAGDSLAGMLHQGARLKPLYYPIAARIIADACAGVHAAHEALDTDGKALNIVHRDISPPNILLSLEGQVKVSDFGIAKAAHQLHSRTRTGDIKGKFAYIPPEQILGKGIARQADIYALGCVLYVATLGVRPFGSGPKAMPKILRGEFKKPTELLESYPKGLEAVILKALTHEPAWRHESADQMREELEAWISSTDDVVTPADVARAVRKRLDPERRQTIDLLRKTNRPLLEAMAVKTEQEVTSERTQTPTAGSGLVICPGELHEGTPSVSTTGATVVSDGGPIQSANDRGSGAPESRVTARPGKSRASASLPVPRASGAPAGERRIRAAEMPTVPPPKPFQHRGGVGPVEGKQATSTGGGNVQTDAGIAPFGGSARPGSVKLPLLVLAVVVFVASVLVALAAVVR
jgi:serine/threonine-protein kinase